MSNFLHFDQNPTGRDFVVGDIHGCFSHLRAALSAIHFDRSRDRLFSVGDLVDRGPESEEVADWLEEPWFFAIRGNHEQMTIEAYAVPDEETVGLHLINGGRWFHVAGDRERKRIFDALTSLPFAMEVDTPSGLVGIVHAEVVGNNWPLFVAMATRGLSTREAGVAMWSRRNHNNGDALSIQGVSRVFVGHTILPSWRPLGNVIYIDTGAFNGGPLTLVNLTDDEIVECPK